MYAELARGGVCSAYGIDVRSQEAKFNREVNEHNRKQKELERSFRQNERKLKVTQRGVMSLLGRDPYPDCNPENILFSHNQPGFCYRRNGTPRRFSSLAESETRKILDDLEGNMGYLEEPASNIVSDNPVLTEVLSAPEIVQILCNLRSTAAIMKDAHLFKQFVRNIQKSSPRPLRFKEKTPYDFLRQYRTDLINQFFEAFQTQAEIRLSSDVPSEAGNNLRVPPEIASDISSLGDNANLQSDSADLEEFATALKAGLIEAQVEPFQPKYLTSDNTTPTGLDSPMTDPIVKQQLLQLGLGKVESFKGLSPSVYGFHDNNTRPTRKPSIAPIPVPPHNTSEATPKSRGVSRNFKPGQFRTKEDGTRQPRNEFDTFVKNLINEVENVSEAGKTLKIIKGQNASRNNGQTTLLKVLRKKSLFSSLTEDDLLFYEYEEGKKGAEKNIARELNIRPNQSYNMAGGFTFHVPTRADSLITTGDYRQSSPIQTSRPESEPLYPGTEVSDETCETLISGSEYSRCVGFKSVHRVCCRACKAKVWHTCDAIRARDLKDKKVTPLWQPPGADEWSNNFTAKDKSRAIKGVPTPSRKNYLYSINASSVPSRPDSSAKYHLHQTPVQARNKFFPTKSQSGSPSPRSGAAGSVYYGSNKTDHISVATGSEHPPRSAGRDSWTLKISRLDILKLRHELDVEQIRGDLESFEKKVIRSTLGSP